MINLTSDALDPLTRLQSSSTSSLQLLTHRNMEEKLIELVLLGVPTGGTSGMLAELNSLTAALEAVDTSAVKVVVFGGGTGLSTIIGGDSRSPGWGEQPFYGLKEVFPRITAIVCTTDDGGSTGELLKDFPLIGLGDIRHVMLSAIQCARLREEYGLSTAEATRTAAALFALFNYRFTKNPTVLAELLGGGGLKLGRLPEVMVARVMVLLRRLFEDRRLARTLERPHCLGNLLLASAIYGRTEPDLFEPSPLAIRDGLREMAALIGVAGDGVLPCTCTPSVLKIRYANGVMATGESKSAAARRGVPIDRVVVDFAEPTPQVLPEVMAAIREADIILFAPGSLYSSIAPVMQVPGLARAVRENSGAMKLLVANIWAQVGETDLVADAPGRRFYVSDLIKAYHRNIPGGLSGLFQRILLLAMREIPGSIIQSYAIEGKSPIYFDRAKVREMGFSPIEASIFSKQGLLERKVRHDPASFAKAVKVLWAARGYLDEREPDRDLALPAPEPMPEAGSTIEIPCRRYERIVALLGERLVSQQERVAEILWRHADIPVAHLSFLQGVVIVPRSDWERGQEWDNLYSFYDPGDGMIKIRQDLPDSSRFEVAFLVGLGQSLLGDYALHKEVVPLVHQGEQAGKVYHLTLRPEAERSCYFSEEELVRYLTFARMRQSAHDPAHFTRVLNAEEGFTPPGLLFGLSYAWYLDNRFASHIEYKMAIIRAEVSDLVPEQVKSQVRRREMIDFFRSVVFRQGE